jgi:predicted RND superfamily exporter protein
MGNDDAEAIHARAAEDRRSQRPWFSRIGEAFTRTPRLVAATTQNYLEGSAGTRFGILVFVGVGLAIAAVGIALAANTAWRVATIPAKLLARREREGSSIPSLFENLKILEIVIGIAMFLVCLSLLMIVLLSAESFLTRQGEFSGAGAAIVWPAPR